VCCCSYFRCRTAG